jgi:DNA-binding MarR family transcriptional regulator
MSRRALLDALTEAGRAHSDATVLFHAAVADQLGLNPTDHKVMSILERSGPLSAGQIAQRTGLATASVTALLDRLETRGFVRRRSDPADRRRVIVEATEVGVARFAPYFASRRDSLSRLSSSTSCSGAPTDCARTSPGSPTAAITDPAGVGGVRTTRTTRTTVAGCC